MRKCSNSASGPDFIFCHLEYQRVDTVQCSQYPQPAEGHPRTGHEGPEGEQMYSSTLPSTSELDGGGWSTQRPGRFTPGKDPVTIVQEAGWGSGPVWAVAGNLAPPPGFDPRTVEPVASRYTD